MNPRIFTRNGATQIILSLFLLILVLIMNSITITSAEVTELNVTPEVVLQGETLLVSGKASPGEEVWLNASFEIALPVSDVEYLGEFNGIGIPAGEKKFSVTAENIKNIQMSIYPVFWHTIEYPLDRPLNATNGTATISISFPATYHDVTIDIYGKKDVRVYGDAADNATSVNLTTELSIKVTANSTGDFSLDINTGGVPPGEFLITAGAIEKTVYIVSAVEEKPDLVITEKWVCWSDNCTICYNITNIGNETAPALHNTTLFVDETEVAHDQVLVELAPNASYIGCFEDYAWVYTPPEDNVTVCADNDKTVDESNETNNCLTNLNIWKCGDVSGEGEITIYDKTLLGLYVGEVPGWTITSGWAADVSGEGEITIYDKTLLSLVVGEVPGWELNCCCSEGAE